MRWLFASVLLVAACGSATGPIIPDAFERNLTGVAVTPSTVSTRRGLDAPTQLKATATFNTSDTKDVTTTATWTSSDPTIATVDASGMLKPVIAGTVTITATVGDQSGTTMVTVVSPTMAVAQIGVPSIDFFDAYASGDAAPLRTIRGATTTLGSLWGLALYNQEIYATDISGAVNVFPVNASGDTAPVRRIAGATTGLTTSYSVAVANDEVFVTSSSKILVYPSNATGDTAPIRTITGAATLLGGLVTCIQVYKDELYVVVGNNSVLVFPRTATGNVAPTRVLTGALTHLSGAYQVLVHDDELYIGGVQNAIEVFATTDSGNVPPRRELTSPGQLVIPIGIEVIGSELYTVNAVSPAQLSVFPMVSTGPVMTPTRQITGPTTGLVSPRTIFLF